MRKTLLRADNMDDALLAGWQIKKGDTEFLTIFSECLQHLYRKTIGEWFSLVLRWNDMIDGGEGSLRVGDGESKVPQHPKSLGTGDLVYEVHPDKKLGPLVGEGLDGVYVPHLVEKVLRHDSRFLLVRKAG